MCNRAWGLLGSYGIRGGRVRGLSVRRRVEDPGATQPQNQRGLEAPKSVLEAEETRDLETQVQRSRLDGFCFPFSFHPDYHPIDCCHPHLGGASYLHLLSNMSVIRRCIQNRAFLISQTLLVRPIDASLQMVMKDAG